MLSRSYLDIERVMIVADIEHGDRAGITAGWLAKTAVAALGFRLSPEREVRAAEWGSLDLLDTGALVVVVQASVGAVAGGEVPVALSVGVWRAGLRSEDLPIAGTPPVAIMVPAAAAEGPLAKAIADLAGRVVAAPLSGAPPHGARYFIPSNK